MNNCLPTIARLHLRSLLVAPAFFALLFSSAYADVKLPRIISNHMVLQKSDKTAIWGWAAPDEDVTVTLDTQTSATKADVDGKWKVKLDLSKTGQGPFELTVAGKNKIVVSDVLVGQVWVAGGQSNMELPLLGTLGSVEEIAHCANPLLRQYFVPHSEQAQPKDDSAGGTWVVAGPSVAGSGFYSAVAYYYAKKLQTELKVPVAIVQSTFGGTSIEQWISSEGFDPDPDLKAAKDASVQSWAAFVDARKKYPDLFNQWLDQTNRQDKSTANPADFAGMDIPTTDWTSIPLPGTVTGAGLPPAGTYWLRKDVTLTAAQTAPPNGKGLELVYLSGANDYESIYWNGEKVVQYRPQDRTLPTLYTFRRFSIPPKMLKEGRNVLAIRLFSPIQAPEVNGNHTPHPTGLEVGAPPLDGNWLAKAESSLPVLDAAGLAAVPVDPGIAYKLVVAKNAYETTQLYNGMINPIIPYTTTGFIWYQGESNAGRAYQYRTTFQLLIKDWRAKWGLGDIPFYFCQLAAFDGASRIPADNAWAEVRESQSLALKLPNTGQAILIDIGEGNIHPRDKKDVGDRLALIALANTYGKKISYSGPVYDSSKIENDKIRISFQHTDGGLVAKPLSEVGKPYYVDNPAKVVPPPRNPKCELQGFAICGADHKYVWADAVIDGTTVVVSSPDVPQPVAVRYAWDGAPTCNLYNGADLPASPFRTDDFPLSTANAAYGKIAQVQPK
jgi:sialate O-acetylesterase